MELDVLINEICARVQEKIVMLEQGQAEAKEEKPKLLILTQEHGTACHEMLECKKLAACYQAECALLANYQCDVKDYEAVIAYTLTNEALGKIAHGIFDSGYTRLFGQALLDGRKIYVAKEDIELYSCETTAPATYYKVLTDNLKVLTDSGVVIASRKEVAAMILGDCEEPASVCCGAQAQKPETAEPEILKEAVLSKKIITEKDMISLGNEKVKKVIIQEKAILTDLAKEYASRHKMLIQRGDISSAKRN